MRPKESEPRRIISRRPKVGALKSYHGDLLVAPECDLLRLFERIADEPIEKEEKEVYFDLNGYTSASGHITGLSLCGYRLGEDSHTILDRIFHLHRLVTLHLQDMDFATMPDSIGDLDQLEELALSSDGITSIPECIGRLVGLKKLYICSRKIRTLPESIGLLTNLEILDIGSENLKVLPEGIISVLLSPSLKEFYVYDSFGAGYESCIERNEKGALIGLDLLRAPFTTLPNRIGELTSLHYLRITFFDDPFILPEGFWYLLRSPTFTQFDIHKGSSGCNYSIQDGIKRNPAGQLIEIDFRDIIVGTVPEIAGEFTALTEINGTAIPDAPSLPPEERRVLCQILACQKDGLQDRGVTITDGHITQINVGSISNDSSAVFLTNLTQLPSLKSLHIQSRGGFSLPPIIWQLSGLEELSLTYMGLSHLPDSIGVFKSLKWLDLQRNKLVALPECIGNLTALQHLDLSGNKLTDLPESMGNLVALTTLRLGNNQLTAVPAWIRNLTILEELYLEFNNVSALPEWIIDLPGLRKLDLMYNHMVSPRCDKSKYYLNHCREYFRILDSLPSLLEKIANGAPLSTTDIDNPNLLRWGPLLEAQCLKYPANPTAKQIMAVLAEKGFVRSKTGDSLWL